MWEGKEPPVHNRRENKGNMRKEDHRIGKNKREINQEIGV